MSKPYASGEDPRIGDDVDLGHGQGPKGRVVVVVGGANPGAAAGYQMHDYESEGPGILVKTESMGLIYENDPDDETILLTPHT